MKQMHVPGVIINEDSARDREIQLDLEELLNTVAHMYSFNWTAPTHDIVRRLMNEVNEFQPIEEVET